jgi:hypothetical protein
MTETIDRDQVEHMAQVAADNALWHRAKYKATGDREHLGQWKAYARGAWCLRRVEYSVARPKSWIEMRTERCKARSLVAVAVLIVVALLIARVWGDAWR